MQLNLQRPLLFFDIESTGLSISNDAIVELSFVKVFPDGTHQVRTWRIKPWDYQKKCQLPMNPDASKVNGITDDMLIGCPTFYEMADEIASWLHGCDLAGFNSSKFDLPMLAEEFERVKLAGKDLKVDLHEPVMVDVQNIYHTMEPRNLKAAYRFYCDADLENAHTAEADTIATYEVLKAQLDRYPELKNDVKALSGYTLAKKGVDFSGYLIYDKDGEVLVNFGKHKGKNLRDVWNSEPSYFAWVLQGSFPLDTKAQFSKYQEKYKLENLAAKFKAR